MFRNVVLCGRMLCRSRRLFSEIPTSVCNGVERMGFKPEEDFLTSKIISDFTTLVQSYNSKVNWDRVVTWMATQNDPLLKEVVTPDNVNLLILSFCRHQKLIEESKSFFFYLMEKNEVSIGLLSYLCEQASRSQEELEKYRDLIYSIYCQLKKEDVVARRLCLEVLMKCKDHWKEASTNLIKDFERPLELPKLFMSAIAFKEIKSALQCLKSFSCDMLEKYSSVVLKMLEYFYEESKKGKIYIEDMIEFFNVLKSNNYTIKNKNDISLLSLLFKQLNKIDDEYEWNIVISKINSDCTCKNCNQKLEIYDINDEEVNILKNSFEECVLRKENNIYLTTFHEEWREFVAFLNNVNYDVVLDGLNIGYFDRYIESKLHKKIPIFEKLKELSMSPLILGRKHMLKNKFCIDGVDQYPLFLTDNISKDDVFIIYAALAKGSKCYILTTDQLRDHKFLCDSALFLKWQRLRQINILGRNLVLPKPVYPDFQWVDREDEEEMCFHISVRTHFILQNVVCASRYSRTKKKAHRFNTADSRFPFLAMNDQPRFIGSRPGKAQLSDTGKESKVVNEPEINQNYFINVKDMSRSVAQNSVEKGQLKGKSRFDTPDGNAKDGDFLKESDFHFEPSGFGGIQSKAKDGKRSRNTVQRQSYLFREEQSNAELEKDMSKINNVTVRVRKENENEYRRRSTFLNMILNDEEDMNIKTEYKNEKFLRKEERVRDTAGTESLQKENEDSSTKRTMSNASVGQELKIHDFMCNEILFMESRDAEKKEMRSSAKTKDQRKVIQKHFNEKIEDNSESTVRLGRSIHSRLSSSEGKTLTAAIRKKKKVK